MTGTINVSTEKLLSTADEFSSNGNTVSALTSEMMSLVTSLSGAWEGEASMAYINKFKSLEKDIQLLNRMVQEHVTDLQQMANAYATAEKENVDAAASLSAGIIS